MLSLRGAVCPSFLTQDLPRVDCKCNLRNVSCHPHDMFPSLLDFFNFYSPSASMSAMPAAENASRCSRPPKELLIPVMFCGGLGFTNLT